MDELDQFSCSLFKGGAHQSGSISLPPLSQAQLGIGTLANGASPNNSIRSRCRKDDLCSFDLCFADDRHL